MQTAALLEFPEPRRMAGRPVDWMAAMICEGGVVAVVVRSWVGSEKVVSSMPLSFDSTPEISLMQESQCMGTEKLA